MENYCSVFSARCMLKHFNLIPLQVHYVFKQKKTHTSMNTRSIVGEKDSERDWILCRSSSFAFGEIFRAQK